MDSGAYTVWTKGNTIEVEDYIKFCQKYSGISYYVNLDIIAGKPGGNNSRLQTKQACMESFRNYERMIKLLPKDKVMPVFHIGDEDKWIDKYLSKGVKYLGLGFAMVKRSRKRMEWLNRIEKYLFDGAGRANAKLHGFALSSFDAMNIWQWHSIDSTTWLVASNMGYMLLPQRTNGEWDYSKEPYRIACTMRCKDVQNGYGCIHDMSPHILEIIHRYLKENNIPFGESVLEKKLLDQSIGDIWFDKKKGIVLSPIEYGVSNSYVCRHIINSQFFKKAEKVLPIKHIYFAGRYGITNLEWQLGNRLLSYYYSKDGNDLRILVEHLESMKESQIESRKS